MNRLFSIIGVLAVTTKSTYYFCLLSYVCLIGACIYVLVKDYERCQTLEIQWILITNALAIMSGTSFWLLTKGSTPSVIGMLTFIANFINMIVLVIYCLTKINQSN